VSQLGGVGSWRKTLWVHPKFIAACQSYQIRCELDEKEGKEMAVYLKRREDRGN
jgi:hypothetical protein